MSRVLGLTLLLCCVLGSAGGTAWAQSDAVEPSARRTGTVANLFETLDPNSPIDGVRLTVPDEWSVQDVHVLRYGTKPVPVRLASQSDNIVLATSQSPLRGPHELVVRVQTGDRSGRYQWHLTPFVHTTSDSVRARRFRTVDRLTRTVTLDAPSRPEGSNQALDLQRAAGPLTAQLSERRAPGRDRPFTIEFWMRTNGLDQVLLSSWTGEEATAYPFEFVVDQSGRLRFYCGRAGRHESLRSKAPVADGHWHHAAVVYDDAAPRLRLLLDGTPVDSLRPRALPSGTGPLPMAIGGRRPVRGEDPASSRRYTGRLDELRIWPRARSTNALREMRNRPFVEARDPDAGPYRLSFNAEDSPPVTWPRGAERVPTTLTFQSPLRGLRAHTDGQSVTLRWTAQDTDTGTFIVERSPNGRSFRVVDRLSPLDTAPTAPESEEIVYTDEQVPGNVVYYRVRQVSPTSDVERTTGTIKIGLGAETTDPVPVTLIGNFPNPFKESTTIAYRVEEPQPITLTVWDLSGKRVATLADGTHEPGYYERTMTAANLPSGPYFARLESNQGVQSERMILLK